MLLSELKAKCSKRDLCSKEGEHIRFAKICVLQVIVISGIVFGFEDVPAKVILKYKSLTVSDQRGIYE